MYSNYEVHLLENILLECLFMFHTHAHDYVFRIIATDLHSIATLFCFTNRDVLSLFCFVHRAALYNLVNRTKLVHKFS